MDALPPESPPQWLPVEARWCVAQQRCIDLEVARSPEQQRRGLMQRPALPPLRRMWFPFARPHPQRFWVFDTLAPLATLRFDPASSAKVAFCALEEPRYV